MGEEDEKIEAGAVATEASEPSTNPLMRVLDRKLRPLLAIFGSAAAASTFLIFAGFLSEFAVYRHAGLPRLSFSVTALIETGADVMVDTISLLFSGFRLAILSLALVGIVVSWAYHDREPIYSWARSLPTFRTMRILLLLLALGLFASLIDRAQLSLAGREFGADSVEQSLARAYSSRFPSPVERQIAIERPSYQMRFFALPNWAAEMEQRLSAPNSAQSASGLSVTPTQSMEIGIPTRMFADSRQVARQVYGWIVLLVFLLIAGIALQGRWAKWLKVEEEDEETEVGQEEVAGPVSKDVDTPQVPVADHRAADRKSGGLQIHWGRVTSRLAAPVELLLAPLTNLLTALCLCLLPLAHGILARPTIGNESVLVYLNYGKLGEDKTAQGSEDKRIATAAKQETGEENAGEGAPVDLESARRFQCTEGELTQIADAKSKVNDALNKLIEVRRSEETDYSAARKRYADILELFTAAVLDSHCGEAVRFLWDLRPPVGLASDSPDLAELHSRLLLRASKAYNVEIGTILTYPRDTQALTLITSVVPQVDGRNPQWSLRTLDSKVVGNSIVLPDVQRRQISEYGTNVLFTPDHDDLVQLTGSVSPDSLEVSLRFLQAHALYAEGVAASISAIGAKTWVAAPDHPELSTAAVDLLASIARNAPWSDGVSPSERMRKSAVTSLHLTRSPYAAYRLAELLAADAADVPCASTKAAWVLPVRCIGEATTAAGFALQDVAREANYFKTLPVPAELAKVRERLLTYLVDVVSRRDVSDTDRGAACSALGFAGLGNVSNALKERYWKHISSQALGTYPFSTPACISRLVNLGLNGPEHRQFLRNMARGSGMDSISELETSRLEEVALHVLYLEGMDEEDQLLYDLFLHPGRGLTRENARKYFRSVDYVRMAPRLRDCASEGSTEVSQRVACLQAFEALQDSFTGDDDDVAQRVSAVLAEDGAGELHEAACGAVRNFNRRGSLWIARRAKLDQDPAIYACLHASLKSSDEDNEAVDKPSRGASPSAQGPVVSSSSAHFAQDVLRAKGLVLVEFWAAWCGPCLRMAPTMEAVARQLQGSVRVVKVDSDANTDLASTYSVDAIPRLLMFRNGRQVASHSGYMEQGELDAWIRKYMAGEGTVASKG